MKLISKRVLAFFVVLTLLVGVLCACTKTPSAPTESKTDAGNSETSQAEEPAQLRISYIHDSLHPVEPQDSTAVALLEKNCNVKIEWLDWGAGDSAGYAEKLGVAVSGGETPDIFYCGTPTIAKYARSGSCLCIDDYMNEKDTPNLKKYMDNKDVRSLITYTSDKKLYSVCALYTEPFYWFGLLARKDIMDELNLKDEPTLEGFYNNLVAMKKAYPSIYPYTIRNQIGTLLQNWDGVFGLNAGTLPFDYNKTNEFMVACQDERFFEMLKWLKKLYDEGLMDPEYNITTGEMWQEKMTTSKGFVTTDYLVRCEFFNDAVRSEDANSPFNLVAISLPTWKSEYKPFLWTNNRVTDYNSWGVSADTKAPEAAVKVLDYCFSDEIMLMNNYGKEGVTWEQKDGKPQFSADTKIATNPTGTLDVNEYRAGNIQLFNMITKTDVYAMISYGQNSYEGYQLYHENDWIMKVDPVVTDQLTDDENSRIAEISTATRTYIEEQAPKFIDGSRPLTEEEYAKFQKEVLETCGAKEAVDILNKAYHAKFD